MSVYFHGSFGLNREYMSGVLRAIMKSPTSDPNEIAKPFGYQAPFTNRYRSWLDKTGILKIGSNPKLTEMGEIVWKRDPKLETLITKWYMHRQLISSPDNAEAWYFFVNEYLPKNMSFTREELEEGLGMKLMGHSAQHFGKGRPMNKVIAKKLIDCYTRNEALGDLGLISLTGKNGFESLNPKQKGPWKTPKDLEKAYSK